MKIKRKFVKFTFTMLCFHYSIMKEYPINLKEYFHFLLVILYITAETEMQFTRILLTYSSHFRQTAISLKKTGLICPYIAITKFCKYSHFWERSFIFISNSQAGINAIVTNLRLPPLFLHSFPSKNDD